MPLDALPVDKIDYNERLKNTIIEWSVQFPLDYAYRKKRGISFGSAEHRRINQLEILADFIEEEMRKEYHEQAEQMIKDKEAYEKGQWLKERVEGDSQEEIELFNKLNVAQLNQS